MTTREPPIERTGRNPAITPEMRKLAQEAMSRPPGPATWREALGRLVELFLLPLWIALALLWLVGRGIAAWRRRLERRRRLKELRRARGGSVNVLLSRWTSADGTASVELDERGRVDATLRAGVAGPRLWAFRAGHLFNGPRGPLQDGDHADDAARFFDAATVAQLDVLSERLSPAGLWVLSSGSAPERALLLHVRGLQCDDLVGIADVFLQLALKHAALRADPPRPPPRVDASWAVPADLPTTVEVRAARLDQFYEYPYDGQLEVQVCWGGPLARRRVPYLEIASAFDHSVLPCGFARGGLHGVADTPLYSERFDQRFFVRSSLTDETTRPLLPPDIRQDLIDLFEEWTHPSVEVDPDGVRIAVDHCAVNARLVARLVALATRIGARVAATCPPAARNASGGDTLRDS